MARKSQAQPLERLADPRSGVFARLEAGVRHEVAGVLGPAAIQDVVAGHLGSSPGQAWPRSAPVDDGERHVAFGEANQRRLDVAQGYGRRQGFVAAVPPLCLATSCLPAAGANHSARTRSATVLPSRKPRTFGTSFGILLSEAAYGAARSAMWSG